MAGDDMPTQDAKWHLDKRVPLALIVMLVIQTFCFGWWASAQDGRVTALEKWKDATAPQADRLTRVEVKLENLQAGIDEIKQLIRAKN